MISSWLTWEPLDWQGRGQGLEENRRLGSCFQNIPAIKPRNKFFPHFFFKDLFSPILSLTLRELYWPVETFVFTVVSIFMFQMGDIYGDMLERDLRKLRLSRSWFLFYFFCGIFLLGCSWSSCVEGISVRKLLRVVDRLFSDNLKVKIKTTKTRMMTSVRSCTGSNVLKKW